MNPTRPEALLSELSVPGRKAWSLPEAPGAAPPLPAALRRAQAPALPELDQLSVVRHFTRLSQRNASIDTEFYPLGSCTMKYNPRINESCAALPGFRHCHPLLDPASSAGCLEVLRDLQSLLAAITGLPGVSLQAAAGAHGELAGVLMIKAWHRSRGDAARTRMLVPDSAHGTNPASCGMVGFQTVAIPSGPDGVLEPAAVKAALDAQTAGIMLTNPNTLGLFEPRIREICELVHQAGGLVYGDGANLNALAGVVRPADLGIDIMHCNLHKTFSTPHGGGGPGAGAIAARSDLADFLPGPIAGPSGMELPARSIGPIGAFFGNFGILVRAYAYIRMHGTAGLRANTQAAVLNANYLRALVQERYPLAYPGSCMHEFVLRPPPGSAERGVHTIDIAKRLIDYGFHPPTVYFPLIVPEAIMVEPTETETRQTLEAFAQALLAIAAEIAESPEVLLSAPHHTPVGRLDETEAARKPVLCWC